MKATRYFTLLILIVILGTGSLSAKNPDPVKKVSAYNQMLVNEVKELVEFPAFAREQGLEGFVLVSYDYDELGRLHVIEANSNSPELRDYVIAKLTELDLCTHARKPGKVYNMRFDFRLI